LIGFATKVGLAPVHSWLPDAHAEAPSPVSAMLSATLLNSAFLVIIRLFKLMQLAGVGESAQKMLLSMGFLSLFVTAVYLFRIANYKRMLAYSSIENMGIIAIGVALGGVGTLAAAIHLAAHSFIKSAFFLTSGNVLKLYSIKEVTEVHGLILRDKLTGWLWIICAALILAIPPSPLFISEFLIILEMYQAEHYLLLFLFVGLLTVVMYGILRAVIKTALGDDIPHEEVVRPFGLNKYLPQILLISIVLIIGLYCPQWLGRLFMEAASWM
jgi:hydrogenase-4 component F